MALIPWTPLLSAALASRAGDSETQKAINEYQQRGDWTGLAKYAAEHLGANRSDSDWWLVFGYAQLQQGDRMAAAAAFTRVTELNPEDIDGWNMLAETQRLSGQPGRATRTLIHAMSIDSSSPVSPYLLGEAYRDDGQFDASISAYRRSMQLEPDYAPAWYGLGLTLIRLGRKEELAVVVGGLRRIDLGLARELEQFGMQTPSK